MKFYFSRLLPSLVLFFFAIGVFASVLAQSESGEHRKSKQAKPAPPSRPPISKAPPRPSPSILPSDEYTDIFSKLSEINAHNGKFNKLIAVLRATGKEPLLRGEGAFTLFAPDDEAIDKLPAGDFDSSYKNRARLNSFLSRHLSIGRVMPVNESRILSIVSRYPKNFEFNSASIKEIESANGEVLTIIVNNNRVTLDSARVVRKDILCRNGIIHLVDTVLVPRRK